MLSLELFTLEIDLAPGLARLATLLLLGVCLCSLGNKFLGVARITGHKAGKGSCMNGPGWLSLIWKHGRALHLCVYTSKCMVRQ